MLDFSVPGAEKSAAGEPFRPARGIARLLVVSIAIAVLLDVVQLGLEVQRLHILGRVASGRAVPVEVARRHDAAFALVAVASLAVFPAAAVAFPFWLHRANRNLPAVGYPNAEYSPGQAAASFFIPFLNLVRPFRVAREIWKGSAGSPPTSAASMPWLPSLWWAAWLGAGLLSWPAISVSRHARTPGSLATLTRLQAVSGVLTIVAGVCAIAMVAGVQRRQSAARWRILHRTGLAALTSAEAAPGPV
jgi:hypothetical protein